MEISKEEPNFVVEFTDGRMYPNNDTWVCYIIHKIFWASVILMLILLLISPKEGQAILGASGTCLLIVFFYLKKTGGHTRKECTGILKFYDEYIEFISPKHHVHVGYDEMEYQRINYKDVTKCEFRVNERKLVIQGNLHEINWRYRKDGSLKETFNKHYNGMIKFYTIFERQLDLVSTIEEHSPLKVDIQ